MKARGIIVSMLSVAASILLAGEPAQATGNPSYTNVVRTPSCNSGPNGLTVCNSVYDYALNPSNNHYVLYQVNVYQQFATLISGVPSPKSSTYTLGLAVGCSNNTRPNKSSTVYGGSSSLTVFCNNGSGPTSTVVNALASVRIN